MVNFTVTSKTLFWPLFKAITQDQKGESDQVGDKMKI